MSAPVMKNLHRVDSYLPIEDHGLVGDGATATLIGRDGSVAWLCVPRFDSLRYSAAYSIRSEGDTSLWHRKAY